MISDDPVFGIKCVHATKSVGTYPILSDVCKSLNIDGTGYGSLATITSREENSQTQNHYLNVTAGMYPYAFIGLRKSCRDCPFIWDDGQPMTFSNWYGTEPNTWNFDCAWMRMASPYNGMWEDWSCTRCVFYT